MTISNIIVGNTSKRATRAGGHWLGKGEVIDSYEGAIPKQAVRDLISWTPVKVPNANLVPVNLDLIGSLTDHTVIGDQAYRVMVREGTKAIIRSDTREHMGVFKEDYNATPYSVYVDATEEAVGDLDVLAAGELDGGRRFFMQVGMSETLYDGTSGLDYMPYLLFRSSLDGSLANTWDRGSVVLVCDNMFPAITRSSKARGDQIKFKRSRLSSERLSGLPALLGVQQQTTVDFVHSAVAVPVLRSQFIKVLDRVIPVPGEDAPKAAITRVENIRQTIDDLYQNSPMVSQWNGTAFGVFQAFNTYNNRERQVRGCNRIDRVFDRVLRGEAADNDATVLHALEGVLGRELVAA